MQRRVVGVPVRQLAVAGQGRGHESSAVVQRHLEASVAGAQGPLAISAAAAERRRGPLARSGGNLVAELVPDLRDRALPHGDQGALHLVVDRLGHLAQSIVGVVAWKVLWPLEALSSGINRVRNGVSLARYLCLWKQGQALHRAHLPPLSLRFRGLLGRRASDVGSDRDVELGASGLGAEPLLVPSTAGCRVLARLLRYDECVLCYVLRLRTAGKDLVALTVEGLVVVDAAFGLGAVLAASWLVLRRCLVRLQLRAAYFVAAGAKANRLRAQHALGLLRVRQLEGLGQDVALHGLWINREHALAVGFCLVRAWFRPGAAALVLVLGEVGGQGHFARTPSLFAGEILHVPPELR